MNKQTVEHKLAVSEERYPEFVREILVRVIGRCSNIHLHIPVPEDAIEIVILRAYEDVLPPSNNSQYLRSILGQIKEFLVHCGFLVKAEPKNGQKQYSIHQTSSIRVPDIESIEAYLLKKEESPPSTTTGPAAKPERPEKERDIPAITAYIRILVEEIILRQMQSQTRSDTYAVGSLNTEITRHDFSPPDYFTKPNFRALLVEFGIIEMREEGKYVLHRDPEHIRVAEEIVSGIRDREIAAFIERLP